MKVVILAGGTGSRFTEETHNKPKPLIEIGGKPILWHIMRHYAHYGFDSFVIALGYKGERIQEYVNNGNGWKGDWNVQLVETGLSTQTGGRIKRLAPHLGDETFMLTWCDGVSNINLDHQLAFHRSHGKLATVTAVHPPSRFGHLDLDGERVLRFSEKPQLTDRWISGAFFVFEPGIFDYIDADHTRWESEPMERLAQEGQLMAYRHNSFWYCMDTLKDKRFLEELWQSGKAPWKVWE